MYSTDYLRLGEHKIFKNLCDTLPQKIKRTKSVVALSDDVLYTWDYQDNCALALNVKAARSREGDNVKHQALMPMVPPLFTPEELIANATNSLLIAFGPNGVLVFELPERTPPYGSFGGNKEVVYCRVHSLYEQTLAFSTRVEIRQVKFHPGASSHDHVAFLTTNNILRIYQVKNNSAICIGVYGLGEQPVANMPSAKVSYLEAFGETAIDFDFGPVEEYSYVEVEEQPKASRVGSPNSLVKSMNSLQLSAATCKQLGFEYNLQVKTKTVKSTCWPIYILYGNGEIYTMTVLLGNRSHPGLHGPHRIDPQPEGLYSNDFCSIICIPSTPPILAVAHCKGKICHVLVLPNQSDDSCTPTKNKSNNSTLVYMNKPNKTLMLLETVELELGLTTTPAAVNYSCPIILHKDFSRLGNYYASHETGVHSITIPFVESLHKFLNSNDDDDTLLNVDDQSSIAEYIICTKTATSDTVNPVIGFAINYDPHSILILLANGQLVTLAIVNTPLLESGNYLAEEDFENMTSPLKKILSDPFDAQIIRILKQSSSQPILKLSSKSDVSQKECYELLQRAVQIFRDVHFKHIEKAREEIEKRVKALKMLKEFQAGEIERLMQEKQPLQEKAENVAERYEDLKEKQEDLMQRCEKLLRMISHKQETPSNAEKKYHGDLKNFEEKVEAYQTSITKLKNKIKYQELQMQNWHSHHEHAKKNVGLGSAQADAIKANLQDTTNKITNMVKDINEYKKQLNLQ